MIRLDKYLCEMQAGTRSEVKNLIRKGNVTVNGQTVKSADLKINENSDEVALFGKPLVYQKYVCLMLNKPAGLVSATRDSHDPTVLDWIREQEPDNPLLKRELPPAGRLDKDTEGFLLMTDDGALSHRLLSPSKHVEKTYYVELDDELDETMVKQLENGVDIGEDTLTKPAAVDLITGQDILPDESHTGSARSAKAVPAGLIPDRYHSDSARAACLLTITEGKFHQVKRMMQAVGREVVYLKRIRMGGLWLDGSLDRGAFRELTPEEISALESDHLNRGYKTGSRSCFRIF